MTNIYFLLCWQSLFFLLICHARMSGSWLSGQTAFTGVWFTSLTFLCLDSSAASYVSLKAFWVVFGVHFSFFVGSSGVSFCRNRNRTINITLSSMQEDKKHLLYLTWTFLLIGTIGSILAVINSSAFEAYSEGALQGTRSMILMGELEVPTYIRVLSNFIYPATLLSVIYFARQKSKKPWVYVIAPFVGLVLYSFSSGGRGTLIIGVIIIFWTMAVSAVHFTRVKDYIAVVGIMCLIIYFFSAILNSRGILTGEIIYESLMKYFYAPIPAFSEWLKINQVSLINIDLTNYAINRELLRFLGFVNDRQIGYDVVFVPFQFNVYTYIAEHINSFGVAGTFIMSYILGMISRFLEMKKGTDIIMGCRSLLYSYLSFSIFADLAFFITGFWFALVTVVVILPIWKNVYRHIVSVKLTYSAGTRCDHMEFVNKGGM